jgi:hypothetical protein
MQNTTSWKRIESAVTKWHELCFGLESHATSQAVIYKLTMACPIPFSFLTRASGKGFRPML